MRLKLLLMVIFVELILVYGGYCLLITITDALPWKMEGQDFGFFVAFLVTIVTPLFLFVLFLTVIGFFIYASCLNRKASDNQIL